MGRSSSSSRRKRAHKIHCCIEAAKQQQLSLMQCVMWPTQGEGSNASATEGLLRAQQRVRCSKCCMYALGEMQYTAVHANTSASILMRALDMGVA
jgi:hypothetical protein